MYVWYQSVTGARDGVKLFFINSIYNCDYVVQIATELYYISRRKLTDTIPC